MECWCGSVDVMAEGSAQRGGEKLGALSRLLQVQCKSVYLYFILVIEGDTVAMDWM